MSPSSTPRCSAIRAASCGCERPEKTISRFFGPCSSQWPGFTSLGSSSSPKPGRRASSVVALSMLVHPAFLRDLPRWEAGEGAWRYILCDHGTRSKPCVVSHLDRRDERIVDPGLDVAADPRPPLALLGAVAEGGGDGAGPDVRVLPDVG